MFLCFFFATHRDENGSTSIYQLKGSSSNSGLPKSMVVKTFVINTVNQKSGLVEKRCLAVEKECVRLKKLKSSPNVVNILCVDKEVTQDCIVYRLGMEKLSKDLFDYTNDLALNDITLQFDSLVLIAYSILCGLTDIHSKGFGHFDIKSENILVKLGYKYKRKHKHNKNVKNKSQSENANDKDKDAERDPDCGTVVECKISDFGNAKAIRNNRKIRGTSFKNCTIDYIRMSHDDCFFFVLTFDRVFEFLLVVILRIFRIVYERSDL